MCFRQPRISTLKIVALMLFVHTFALLSFGHQKPKNNECKAYFIVVEQDAVTVNLKMIGFNDPQQSWYAKHGGEFPGLCPVTGDATGKRMTLDAASQDHLESVVGTSPLFEIAWEEHKVFVPDTNGGALRVSSKRSTVTLGTQQARLRAHRANPQYQSHYFFFVFYVTSEGRL